MSRHLPTLNFSARSWDVEVLAEVRSCAAPVYAVAQPTGQGHWQVFLLERPDAAVRESFCAGPDWPRSA
ncbi:hypothetical protein, partial [Streptomyces sp. SID5770]|uniref:hypothetical protein n=1 Tax=Streptomyces sp. SID5770 TaxID=2690308 RepID=UPI001F42B526